MAKRGSVEWHKNISKGRSGKPGPSYWSGKKHTDDYKKRMSKRLSGKRNPRYGAVVSEETRQKISRSLGVYFRKNGTDNLKGPRPRTSVSLMGHPMSKNTREKISERVRGRFVGENNPNWKGGITPLGVAIRNSSKYARWRDAVFDRDNFECRYCGVRGGDKEVHHVVSLSELVVQNDVIDLKSAIGCDDLWDVNNGETVCIGCHSSIDAFRNV